MSEERSLSNFMRSDLGRASSVVDSEVVKNILELSGGSSVG
jgi:hypothetical protein